MREIVVNSNEAGQRLDKFLHKYLKAAGSGFLYKMLRKKNITLNGGKAGGSEKLAEGDKIKLFLAEETIEKFRTDATAAVTAPSQRLQEEITIIYEDRHILLADKPSGILTQKAEPSDVSLNDWLIHYMLESGQITKEQLRTFRPSVCNRLDRNTSGLVICGKSLTGSQQMSRLLKERSLHKYYRALAAGRMEETGAADAWLQKDAASNTVTVLKKPPAEITAEIQYIRTGYKPLRYLEGCTDLEVELFTGKTHQIRAHLAALGHPLIGDPKYGKSEINRRFNRLGVRAQMLHAYRLVFPPLSGEFASLSEREFIAPLPPVYERLLQNGCRTLPNY